MLKEIAKIPSPQPSLRRSLFLLDVAAILLVFLVLTAEDLLLLVGEMTLSARS